MQPTACLNRLDLMRASPFTASIYPRQKMGGSKIGASLATVHHDGRKRESACVCVYLSVRMRRRRGLARQFVEMEDPLLAVLLLELSSLLLLLFLPTR